MLLKDMVFFDRFRLNPTLRLWVWFMMIYLGISALSIFGRQLQNTLESFGLLLFGKSENHVFKSLFLSLIIGALLLLTLYSGFLWAKKSSTKLSKKQNLSFLFLVAGIFLMPFFLPLYVERIHFITFGALGFVSYSLIQPISATLLFCAFFSYLDEQFQYFLPHRYYDTRDIMINFSACLIGIWIARLGVGK